MKREVITKLKDWKMSANRKPLVLRGSRQVGKTWILKEFGALEFPAFHYINFEEDPRFFRVFSEDIRPERVIAELSLLLRETIAIEDLIIFDEVQLCPRALTALKYFYENMPQQAICAAGSLLGVMLGPESFPVGKVTFLDMHPFSFVEFLSGTGNADYAAELATHDLSTPFSPSVHETLLSLWKRYLVTGGMPEAINALGERQPDFEVFNEVRRVQSDLINAHLADVAKHSGKTNALHIDRVWRNVPGQLARAAEGGTTRFRFKGVLPGIRNYERLAGPIDWLEGAGLLKRVPIVECADIPLAAQTNENRFKLYFGDVGLLGAMSRLDPASILSYDFGSFKGYLAENAVAQALTSSGINDLYCWQGRTSEIEFVVYKTGATVIPIEVKAGTVTRSQSLRIFRQKYKPVKSIIVSAKNSWVADGMTDGVANEMIGLPLYATSRLGELL